MDTITTIVVATISATVGVLLLGLGLRCCWFLGVFKRVKNRASYNRFPCRILGDTAEKAPSVEDFRFVSDNIVLLSAGSVLEFVGKGDVSSPHGHIVAVDMVTERSRTLELSGFPSDKAFRPHGIEYSTRTRTLYVVNHADNGEERVDMFKVSGVDEGLDAVELKWVDCLLPPVPAGTLNAVTEASERDVYVTQWLPFSLPRTGVDHPNGLMDTLRVIGNYGWLIAGRGLGLEPLGHGFTEVIRCDLSSKTYHPVRPRFVSCNGITSTPDGKLVFVVDCSRQFLAVFNRNVDTGALSVKKTIPMPHVADNVCLKPLKDGGFELWFGTMPDWFTYLMEALKKDKRLVPGGFLVGKYDESNPELVTFEDVFIHDGSLLPVVATAGRWRDHILLSGPQASGGVLICSQQAS